MIITRENPLEVPIITFHVDADATLLGSVLNSKFKMESKRGTL